MNKNLLQDLNFDSLNYEHKAIVGEILASCGLKKLKEDNPNLPKLAYLLEKDWDSRAPNNQSLPIQIPKNEFILSTSKYVNKATFEDQGLNAITSIICLAASGIDLMLPNVNFNLASQEEIQKIKEVLYEERIAYLNAVSKIADESLDRIKSGNHLDTLRWARNEVALKILPSARILEEKIQKVHSNDLKKSGFAFWKNGVPAIMKAHFEGGWVSSAKTGAVEILKILAEVLSRDSEKRNLPEISYALKIRENFEQI